ncbi:MAG: hypothetical protein H0W50_06470 [Parachlamydiaceae bacterium]|nr:hypothetical protein [Parachlamydiaceae bacterium]
MVEASSFFLIGAVGFFSAFMILMIFGIITAYSLLLEHTGLVGKLMGRATGPLSLFNAVKSAAFSDIFCLDF